MSETPTSSAIFCPGCQSYVEETKYPEHINSNHSLNKITIKGAGTVLVPPGTPKGPVFLDIPYVGRVRRDAFFAWSFIMLLLGILLGSGRI